MSSSYILITSRERDRLIYPNPCEMTTTIKGSSMASNGGKANIFTASNPLCDIPLYNFSFPNFDNNSNSFMTSITSIEGKQLTLDKNIDVLLNRQLSDNINLAHSITEASNILNNFTISIELGGNKISRKITSYNNLNSNIITIEHGFPLIVNSSSNSLPCTINTSSSNLNNSILCNGDFLQNNDFYYNNNSKKYLYNVSQNEIKSIQSINDNQEFVLSSAFSNENYNDQYMLFYGQKPLSTGKILIQENSKFYSFQPSRIKINKSGNQYKNGEVVFLKSQSQNNNIIYTEFTLEKVTGRGEIHGIENLRLSKLGNQEFQTSMVYEVVKKDQNQAHDRSTIIIITLELTFMLNIPKFDFRNNFFFPVIMSNQYKISNNGKLEIHPNSSLLNSIDKYKQQQTVYDHYKSNGISPITNCFTLEGNTTCAIQTKTFSDINRRFEFLEQVIQQENIPYIRGIDNFLVLDFKKDGVQELNYNPLQKHLLHSKISLKSIVLPNKMIKNTGCLTKDLSYILVDIDNVSNSVNYNHNVIQSNSPAASKSKFFVPLTKCIVNDQFLSVSLKDVQCPISFSPNDNLSIKLLLPNNEVIMFDEEDFTIPYESNMSLNISLFFEVSYD